MSKRKLPDTSHVAKAMASELRVVHQDKILMALGKIHIGTYVEIANACGLDRHAVHRRLHELEPPCENNPKGLNKVWKPGGKKNTPNGRPAYLYQLVGEPAKVESKSVVNYAKAEMTASEHAKNIIKLTTPQYIEQSFNFPNT